MFGTKLFNFCKIASNKICKRIYYRTIEQLEFDKNISISLGVGLGSGICLYHGKINKNIDNARIFMATINGGIIGGSLGYILGYIYPYTLITLPPIIVSYEIYQKFNSDKIIIDDISLTQKPN
jgi:hypothetical protein